MSLAKCDKCSFLVLNGGCRYCSFGTTQCSIRSNNGEEHPASEFQEEVDKLNLRTYKTIKYSTFHFTLNKDEI